jgi:hypothetical protein
MQFQLTSLRAKVKETVSGRLRRSLLKPGKGLRACTRNEPNTPGTWDKNTASHHHVSHSDF